MPSSFKKSRRHFVIVRAKLLCRDFIKEELWNLLSKFHFFCCPSIIGKSTATILTLFSLFFLATCSTGYSIFLLSSIIFGNCSLIPNVLTVRVSAARDLMYSLSLNLLNFAMIGRGVFVVCPYIKYEKITCETHFFFFFVYTVEHWLVCNTGLLSILCNFTSSVKP